MTVTATRGPRGIAGPRQRPRVRDDRCRPWPGQGRARTIGLEEVDRAHRSGTAVPERGRADVDWRLPPERRSPRPGGRRRWYRDHVRRDRRPVGRAGRPGGTGTGVGAVALLA